MKKILALFLTVLTMLGAFSSCNKQSAENTVEDSIYIRTDNKIIFGSYPQTEVTDSNLKSNLTSKAGTLPTSSDSQAWTSYDYYIEGKESNFMWYIDIEENGEKYRGVYFTSYRPMYTTYASSTERTWQDDNGYAIGNVYWFKYEPVSWTILSENDGTAFLLCDMIIDSREYCPASFIRRAVSSAGLEIVAVPNNYDPSEIAEWLNFKFYNTAFNARQRETILTTTIDNSVASTGFDYNIYACENTSDKIFLLSYKEVTNSSYGFSVGSDLDDDTRQKKVTDYAKSQGVQVSNGNGAWWLRSPYCDNSNCARVIFENGYPYPCMDVQQTCFGIVPALRIKL